MTHVVQNGTTGVNGHHVVKHVVKVNKNDLEPMSVRTSLTTSKLELAASNFPLFHITNGLLGVNALQHVLVVSWSELLNIFVVKCSVVILPLVVQRVTGKNGDRGLVAVSHAVLDR